MKTGRSKRLHTRLVRGPLERVSVLSFVEKILLVSMFSFTFMRPVFTSEDLTSPAQKTTLFSYRLQSR